MTQLDRCGHFIHQKCLNDYIKNANGYPNCPLCGMSLQKEDEAYIKYVDDEIAKTLDKFPEEVKNKKVDIYCNNCR